jgi:hypothetical protein
MRFILDSLRSGERRLAGTSTYGMSSQVDKILSGRFMPVMADEDDTTLAFVISSPAQGDDAAPAEAAHR